MTNNSQDRSEALPYRLPLSGIGAVLIRQALDRSEDLNSQARQLQAKAKAVVSEAVREAVKNTSEDIPIAFQLEGADTRGYPSAVRYATTEPETQSPSSVSGHGATRPS